MIHTVKGFNIVNEREVDIFLAFICFLCDPVNVGNLISGSSAFCKPSLYIWKFSVYVLLKPSLKDFECYLANMWNEYSCIVVWTFFGIALLWDWNENWPFPVLRPNIAGLQRKLKAEKLMLLNCGVGEDSWESPGLQGDPTNPFWRRSALGVHW